MYTLIVRRHCVQVLVNEASARVVQDVVCFSVRKPHVSKDVGVEHVSNCTEHRSSFAFSDGEKSIEAVLVVLANVAMQFAFPEEVFRGVSDTAVGAQV